MDFTIPELQNHQWTNLHELANGLDDDKNGFVDDIWGWNFFSFSANINPLGGHGTRIAGLIVKNSEDKNIKIMPLIACEKNYGCSAPAIVSAIKYAADNGASIINLSFGDTAGFSQIYDEAIKYAQAKGLIIVAASGGIGQGKDLSMQPISPVCNDLGTNAIIGVSSVDLNKQLPIWANWGMCVDVFEQGTDIVMPASPQFESGLVQITSSGTSYSAAIVSGKIAKIKLAHPEWAQIEILNELKNPGANHLLAFESNIQSNGQVLSASVSSVQPVVKKAEKAKSSQINKVKKAVKKSIPIKRASIKPRG